MNHSRIALYTDSDVFAGTERHILELARGLRNAGVGVRIACPASSPLARRAVAEGVGVIPIEKRGPVDIAAALTLRRLLRAGELDVIHTHNGHTAVAAALAVRLAGRGHVVATQHFIEPGRLARRGLRARLANAIHGWVNARLAHCIAISEAVRSGMIERDDVDETRISVVHNGITAPDESALAAPEAIRAELGIPSGAPLVVCVARLEREKDIATLIDAMREVRAQRPQVRCVISGEGSEHDALLDRIARHGLSDVVTLAGFRSDALAVIRAADVFVLPSRAEPFGLVILEAMALGRGVIVTAAGGPLEIVEDGTTGLLVPPGDSAALAVAINRLIAEPETRRTMGALGRARFEKRFTAQKMGAATLAVYTRATQPLAS